MLKVTVFKIEIQKIEAFAVSEDLYPFDFSDKLGEIWIF